jgi:hypothetical protein
VCSEEDQQTAAIVKEYDGDSDSDNDEIGAPAMGVKMDLSSPAASKAELA